jgi:uncharacterized protein (DUF849 family)
MKPTFETSDQRKSRDSFALRFVRRGPLTDCNYHSVALGGHNGARATTPSFRNISNEYFKSEARHSFVAEASFFVAIVLTAALPLVNSAHAVADFVRAIGGV